MSGIFGPPRSSVSSLFCATISNKQSRVLKADVDHKNNGYHLTREEIAEALELGARSRLQMSAREMIDRYRHGKLDDAGEVADLLMLASLLQPDDELAVDLVPS